MSQCPFCQGEIDTETQHCRQCGRDMADHTIPAPPARVSYAIASFRESSRAPSPANLQPARPEAPGESASPRPRLSRRKLLLGLAGVAVSGGVLGRLVYLWATTHTVYTYRGHTAWVESLAWSPTSRRIVSGSDDRTAQVWDALTGDHRLTYTDPIGIQAVAWSPDGQLIVSGSWDGTATVWEAATGKRIFIYKGHRPGQSLTSIRSVPRSDRRADAISSQAASISLHPERIIVPGVESLAWSPNGRQIASTGGDGTAQVWEALTGKLQFTMGGYLHAVSGAVWSPDGKRLATGAYGAVSIWDVSTGNLLLTYQGHTDVVSGLAWSPDGKHLASASDQSIHLWDADTGQRLLIYNGHTDFVDVIAWSPDSRYLASAGFDLTVQVWEAATGKTRYIYRGHMGIFRSFFSAHPAERSANAGYALPATSTQSSALIKGASRLAPLLPLDGPPRDRVTTVAWAPNGQYLASGGSDQTVQVWTPG